MSGILIVDDEEGIREVFKDALEEKGHRVTLAHDGFDALEKIADEFFDLVITDLKMPRCDGCMLLAAIQRGHTDLPVILLSSHGTNNSTEQMLQLGFAAVLPKPVNICDFIRVTEQVLLTNHFKEEP